MTNDTLQKLGNEKLSKLAAQINKWNQDELSSMKDNTQVSPMSLVSNSSVINNFSGSSMDSSSFSNIKTDNKSSGSSDNTNLSEESFQHVNYLKNLSKKYRTIPCKNYHSSQGCGRGTLCHFIHLAEYEGILLIYKLMFKNKILLVCLLSLCVNYLKGISVT